MRFVGGVVLDLQDAERWSIWVRAAENGDRHVVDGYAAGRAPLGHTTVRVAVECSGHLVSVDGALQVAGPEERVDL